MPLVSVDQSEVGVEALGNPRGELSVVDAAGVAQDGGEEMLLLLRC